MFNLSDGTIVSTSGSPVARIDAMANGWYRCSLHATATTAASGDILIALCASGSASYAGNGSKGLYLWGAQFENGIAATSYIATASAQVTRAGDSLLAATSGLGWWSASEFTVAARAETTANDGTTGRYFYQIDNGSTPHRLYGSVVNGNYTVNAVTANTQVVAITHALGTAKLMTAIAAFKENDYASCVPAVSSTIQTDTSGTMPSGLTTVRIGMATSTNGQLNGWFKTIRYWATRLSDAQIGDIS